MATLDVYEKKKVDDLLALKQDNTVTESDLGKVLKVVSETVDGKVKYRTSWEESGGVGEEYLKSASLSSSGRFLTITSNSGDEYNVLPTSGGTLLNTERDEDGKLKQTELSIGINGKLVVGSISGTLMVGGRNVLDDIDKKLGKNETAYNAARFGGKDSVEFVNYISLYLAPNWNADFPPPAYSKGSICSHNGDFYISVKDNNLNNEPSSESEWWRRITLQDVYYRIDDALPYRMCQVDESGRLIDRMVNSGTVDAYVLPAALEDGKARDFALVLDLTSGETKEITINPASGETVQFLTDSDDAFSAEAGKVNILYFSEITANKFMVVRKAVA